MFADAVAAVLYILALASSVPAGESAWQTAIAEWNRIRHETRCAEAPQVVSGSTVRPEDIKALLRCAQAFDRRQGNAGRKGG